MDTIHTKIEGFLFWKGESVTITELARALKLPREGILQGLTDLEEALKGRGIRLIRTEDSVELRTAAELSPFIEELTKEELDRDLGKAGLETLSIVLYEGPISRRDIDYIRGVNSQFIVRNLMVRGLVERVEASEGKGFLYKPTIELLAHLGVEKVQDLPEYEASRAKMAEFKNQQS